MQILIIIRLIRLSYLKKCQSN